MEDFDDDVARFVTRMKQSKIALANKRNEFEDFIKLWEMRRVIAVFS